MLALFVAAAMAVDQVDQLLSALRKFEYTDDDGSSYDIYYLGNEEIVKSRDEPVMFDH